jgi:hypothetical protein
MDAGIVANGAEEWLSRHMKRLRLEFYPEEIAARAERLPRSP